ncbi:MAG: type I DNA topoisomerase [Fibrobacteres bacterium]|nr:type I DNA topoisomerase [Fibrobacterota bacterium]
MSNNLIIVESPAKSRTIGKYLGKDFTVKASMGHIIDLPVKEFGIDIDNGFAPKYVTMKGKAKIITELKKAAAKADTIYLAPDPDREGEAIAWHIADIVSKVNPTAVVHRILLNEITKNAVKAAIATPLKIDLNKVNAQQARRILDRIVGYKISPFLWKALYRGLSAGRVQSVALRLICEREAERDAFNKEEYWTLEVNVRKADGRPFTVKLFKLDSKDPDLKNEPATDAVIEAVKGKEWKITDVSYKTKRRNPLPPFITSTIQQEAARRLHFSASKTMSLAQQLYEGLDLGESTVGLITYMRTDSTRVSNDAKVAASKYIEDTYGKKYLPETFKEYKKNENAQDAHEAIRPTNIDKAFEPEKLKGYLSKDQYRLYDLVWRRFLASQMVPAEFDLTTAEIEIGNVTFRAAGSVMKFDGFMSVYGQEEPQNKQDTDNETPDDDSTILLPELIKGETITPDNFDKEQHFTQPPPRYSEATLVKELEKQGIGRPSTYAQIIDTLKKREYVELEQRRFTPSLLGKTINGLLVKEFPDIFDVSFTANMEDHLDKVESGEDDWIELLKQFYEPLKKDLKQAQEKARELKKSLEEESGEICVRCGQKMVVKWGRNGRFLACSAYPACKSTKPLEEDLHDASGPAPDMHCRLCNAQMIVKRWKKSRFMGCSRYPDCKGVMPYPVGVKCPEENCTGYIAERYSQRGKIFFSCSEYPKCKFASWSKPVNKACDNCDSQIMLEMSTKAKGNFLRCIKCKAETLREQEEVD